MKSVLQALFRLTMALGNLLDILVISLFPADQSQTLQFILFAVLMLIDMLVLAMIARKYVYKEEADQKFWRNNSWGMHRTFGFELQTFLVFQLVSQLAPEK